MFLKDYNTEFNDITVTLTDQNGRPLEKKTNLILVVNKCKWHIIHEAKNKKIHQKI